MSRQQEASEASKCNYCQGKGWYLVQYKGVPARKSCEPCQGTGFAGGREP